MNATQKTVQRLRKIRAHLSHFSLDDAQFVLRVCESVDVSDDDNATAALNELRAQIASLVQS